MDTEMREILIQLDAQNMEQQGQIKAMNLVLIALARGLVAS